MNKVVRGMLGGVAMGIMGEFFGWLIYGVIFMKWTVQVSQMWRPMESAYWRIGMPLVDIFSGMMIALGYAILYKGIPGTGLKKGLAYGLILWLIARFTGELFGYVMSPIPFMLVIAGWIHGLIVMSLGGLVIAALYGKTLEKR